MKAPGYLFDTHAPVFRANKTVVSPQFLQFFDEQNRQGTLYVSAISFWDVALLAQKGRLALPDVHGWKDEQQCGGIFLERRTGCGKAVEDTNSCRACQSIMA